MVAGVMTTPPSARALPPLATNAAQRILDHLAENKVLDNDAHAIVRMGDLRLLAAAWSERAPVPKNMVLVCATCRFSPSEDHIKACSSGEACPFKFGVVRRVER